MKDHFIESLHKTRIIREAASAAEEALFEELTPALARGMVLDACRSMVSGGSWRHRATGLLDVLALLMLSIRCSIHLRPHITSIEMAALARLGGLT